eukprot:COSAG01_NODE_398_length_17547_cov_206.793501_14_plen_247_part_00
MKWQNVIQLVQKQSSYNIKFFKAIDNFDVIGELLTAYANFEGGQIVLGFDVKNLHFVGSNQSKTWITDQLKKFTRPHLDCVVNQVEKDNKFILIIEVKRHNHRPCYYKNLCYVIDKEHKSPRLAVLENKLPKSSNTEEIEASPVQSFEENKTFADQLKTSIDGEDLDIMEPALNERQSEALDFLKKEQEIQNKTYRDLCKVSHKTAHLELVDLVSKGFIEQQGSGRSTKYVLKDKNGTNISFASLN